MRKNVGWRLLGLALLVGAAVSTSPADGHAYCCSCDFLNSYHYCLEGCGSDQACQNKCYEDWSAAEDRCIRNCPYGAVC